MKDPRAWWIDAGGIAACAALTLGAFAAGVRPVLQAKAQQIRMFTELRQTKTEADQMSDMALEAERRHAEVLREQQQTDFALRGPRHRLERLQALSDLAANTGLVVLQVDPAEPSSLGQHMAYPLRISGRGSFAGVTAFLERLHTEFRDVRVVRCRLMRSREADAENTGAETGKAAAATSDFEFGLVWFAVRDGSIATVPDGSP